MLLSRSLIRWLSRTRQGQGGGLKWGVTIACGLLLAMTPATCAGQISSRQTAADDTSQDQRDDLSEGIRNWLDERSQIQWQAPELQIDDGLSRQLREEQAEASACFMEGRMLMRSGQLSKALDQFQRAWRFSAGSSDAAHHVLFLLLQLDRDLEATRYAKLIDPHCLRDSESLLDLAGLLTDANADAQAVRYYRRWLKAYGDESVIAMRLLVQMEIGRLSYLMDEYEDAAQAFDQVLKASRTAEAEGRGELVRRTLFADPQMTLSMIGESYFRAGRLDQSNDLFELAFAAAPEAPEYLIWQARIAFAQGDVATAWQRVNRALSSDELTSGADALELMRELLQRQSETPEEYQRVWIAKLTELEEQHNVRTQVLGRLAEAYREQGNDTKSIAYYERLVTIAPSQPAIQALALLYEKHAEWKALLKLYASTYEIRRDLEWIDAGRERFTAEGPLAANLLQAAQQTLESQQTIDNRDEAMVLAIIACRAGERELAQRFFQMAITLADDPRLLGREWTIELLSNEAYAEVVEFLERQLEPKSDDNVETEFLLAGAYAMTEQGEKAEASARSAFDRLPSSLVVRNRLAWVLQRQGQWQRAREVYETTLKMFGESDETNDQRDGLRQTRMGCAAVAAEQGRIGDAEELLLTVLSEFPDDAGALNDLGFLWSDHGMHLEMAYRMIHRAVQQEPENGAFQDSLGWALLQLGRVKESVEALQTATSITPDDPDFWEHLGDAYAQAGSIDQARQAWQTAQDQLPQSTAAAERQRLQAKIDAIVNNGE